MALQQVDGAAARRTWLSVLARAELAAIAAALDAVDPLPPHRMLRGPESGLILVRGRAGGDGEPFPLGEATMARASVVAPDRAGVERVGHAWRLGRDLPAVELSARLDAALQDPLRTAELHAAVIAPLAAAQAAAAARTARRAAATRVSFDALAVMR